MKRITLLAVLALMVAVALPVMAVDLTWTGELTYGAITDGTTAVDAYSNAYLDAKAVVDPNNTIYANLLGAFAGTGLPDVVDLSGTITVLSAFSGYFNVFYLTSDIGKIFGLNGITAVATVGWLEPSATSYSLTTEGYESIMAYDPWGVSHDTAEVVVGFGAPLNLQVFVSPIDSTDQSQPFSPQFIVNAYGGMGPINYSVAYESWSKTAGWTSFMGAVGAAVKYSQAFGDITPAVNAEVSYDLTSSTLSIGYAASVAYTTLIKVAFGGVATTAGLGNLSIQADLVPMKGLGVDVYAFYTPAATTQFSVDGSVWYLFGATKLRVGYVYGSSPIGGPSAAPANVAPNGGVYALVDLTF
ncbi:MAG: hypothetical protein ABSF77_02030 [Spirochaetia bacterium]|jgi:hypothetical protein